MIIVLKDGNVVEQGTHEKLVDGGTVYSSMWAGKHLSFFLLFLPSSTIILSLRRVKAYDHYVAFRPLSHPFYPFQLCVDLLTWEICGINSSRNNGWPRTR